MVEALPSLALALVLTAAACSEPPNPDRGAPASVGQPPAPTAALDLAALCRILRGTTDVDAARAALAAAGMHVEPFTVIGRADETGLRVTVAPALDAAAVARALGIAMPCAVSGDVHQRSWWLQACAPFEGNRLAAKFPRLGGWWLSVELDGRPAGPLPDTVAGASPAYDLTKVPARVVLVEARPGASP
jgi:hypothetical protein